MTDIDIARNIIYLTGDIGESTVSYFISRVNYLIEENKVEEVKNMLSNLVPSYQSNSKIVDHFYKQQLNSKNDFKSPKIINSEENKVVKIRNK